MSNPSLLIKDISVYKLPGFPRGMLPLHDFARHINIIAGPNGSGKSSTARLIRQLLWQQQLGSVHADFMLDISGVQWGIQADNGHYRVLREGQPDTLPSLPAADESKRYLLALHELVGDMDTDLAALLIREASGGYDLPAAQHKLGYDSRTKQRTITEYRQYNEAKIKIAGIENRQKQLTTKADSLQSLFKARNEAAAASNYHDLYTCLIASLNAGDTLNRLQHLLDDYPPQLRILTGQEFDRIVALEGEIQINNRSIETISGEIHRKETRISELNLPEKGISKALLEELHTRVDTLLSIEQKLGSLDIDIAGAELMTAEALEKLASELRNTDIKPLDVSGTVRLAQFMEGAHRLLSEKQYLETTVGQLKKEQQIAAEDPSKIQEGINALLLWYQERSPLDGIPAWALWVLLLLGIITGVATLLLGWLGLITILLMLGFLLYAARGKRADDGEVRKKDFVRTGLREPQQWDIPGVAARLEELNIASQEAKRLNLLAVQLKTQEDALTDLLPRLAKLDEQRDLWLNEIGVIPLLSADELKDYSGLYWFLASLLTWQQCFAQLKALEEQKVLALDQQKNLLSAINVLIKDIAAEVADGATAKGMYRQLQADETERSTLSEAVKQHNVQLEDKKGLGKKLADELAAIYERLELEEGKKEEIWVWNQQLAAFRQLHKDHQDAGTLHSDKNQTLKAHNLFLEIESELDALTLDEAKLKCAAFKQQADKLDELNKQIIEIERDIEHEKEGTAMEDALAIKEASLNGLEQIYLNNLSAMTGDLVVGLLKETYREQNSAGIFGKANQLFSRITNGRYQLTVEESGAPAFRAYDTIYKNWLELSQLSTGTRIQLLLAVRLAFIEMQEQNVKLPILADEILANSDDLRAKEIISALAEISKEGRQVFYFTAQADEIDKWKAFKANDAELDFKIFTLDGQHNEKPDYRLEQAPLLSGFKIINIPLPGTLTAEEYRKLIKVPRFNPLTEEPEQLHLWYLLDDQQLLYTCLAKRIGNYGQLKGFMQYQGSLPGLDENLWATLQVKIRLLESYQELFRRGRSKPIDRQTLVQSGAVSGTFIDLVAEKLKELNGDPQRLLLALGAKEVQGFLQSKLKALEQYLIGLGVIDDQQVLSAEDLQVRLMALVSNLDIPEVQAYEFIDKVMS